MATTSKSNDNSGNMPEHIIDSLARCLLPALRRYYESEEGQRAFAEWKARQKGIQ